MHVKKHNIVVAVVAVVVVVVLAGAVAAIVFNDAEYFECMLLPPSS